MKGIVTVNSIPFEQLTEEEKVNLKENIMQRLEDKGLKRVKKEK